ncbi:MAG: hypothetical protein KJP21_06180 [Bacteroidia bacterium]|nr:hypothetical protein [Bacteroidia bacterium]NNJ55202.1 hypothetical protein [Bacteroidia bacterium]
MNTHKLEKQLQTMHYTFSDDFDRSILEEISTMTQLRLPSLTSIITGLAACIIFCLGFIYLQDGNLSYDSLLGIDMLNKTSSTELLNYF